MSNELTEKANYSKPMKADSAKWRKFLKTNELTIKDAYQSFNEINPDTLSYDGFYKSLTNGKFTYQNYVKAKDFFNDLEIKIKESKTVKA